MLANEKSRELAGSPVPLLHHRQQGVKARKESYRKGEAKPIKLVFCPVHLGLDLSVVFKDHAATCGVKQLWVCSVCV